MKHFPLKYASLFLLLSLNIIAGSVYSASSAIGDGSVNLSQKEIEWLKAHPELRIAPAPNYPPVEFFDEKGKYRGITADFFAIIEKKLGIKFNVEHLPSWAHVVEKTKLREIDLWGEAAKTPERSEYMRFTTPYLKFPSVIIVRRESDQRKLGIEGLAGLKVVAIKGYATTDYLKGKYPDLDLIEVSNIETGLKMVSFNLADAIVVSAAPATYYIEKIGLGNLIVTGESGYTWELGFASRSDWPELQGILQKTLDSISDAERNVIFKKWLTLSSPKWKPSRGLIMFIVIVIALIIFMSILLWNLFLERKINSQTHKIRSQLNSVNEARFMLHTVLDHIPGRVFWKDKDLKYMGCNELFAKDAGLGSPEAIVGKSDYDLPWAEEADMYRADDMEVITSGEEIIKYEESQTTPDGREIWLETSKVLLKGADGNIYGILGTYQDITERKDAEQEMNRIMGELSVKTHGIEESNRELSQYAYVISHDLKTPLRAIHNYADFLREDLEDSLDGDQREYLDGLGRAVKQSEELVNDLLDLSRVGKDADKLEAIESGDFLLSMIKSFDLPDDVEVEIAGNMPVVLAEPLLLRQVFQNLITNAVKFNLSERKRVEIGWVPREENYVDLYVKDNGIGIDERYHKQIFSVFQRLHTREEYEGTGIGLAIVHKALEKLKGSIRLESEAGKGSTFFVSLPMVEKDGK